MEKNRNHVQVLSKKVCNKIKDPAKKVKNGKEEAEQSSGLELEVG